MILRIGGLPLLFALSAGAASVAYQVTITNVPVIPATLFLTLTDGGTPSNTVTVANFLTGAQRLETVSGGILDEVLAITLGSSASSGGVSGGLPGTLMLTDSAFFSEYRLALSPSNLGTISFYLAFTNNAPDSGSFPDGFALYLLDASFNSVLASSDPTGAQALLAIDGGDGTANLYNSNVSAVATALIPEPNTLWFLTGGIVLMLLRFAPRGALAAVLVALASTAPTASAAARGCTGSDCNFRYTHPTYNWYVGVPTLPDDLARTQFYPIQVQIHWGDGSFSMWDGPESGGTRSVIEPYFFNRIVSNLGQCNPARFLFIAVHNPYDCVIRARHVYAAPAVYTVEVIAITGRLYTGAGGGEVKRTSFQINVIAPLPGQTYNVLSVGDSAASGEGAPNGRPTEAFFVPGVSHPLPPTYATGFHGTNWAVLPQVAAAARDNEPTGSLACPDGVSNERSCDVAEWDTYYADAEGGFLTAGKDREAHRSNNSPAATLARNLQSYFIYNGIRERVNFWDRSFSGATTGAIADQILGANAARVGSTKFHAVVISAGANDIPMSQLVLKCLEYDPRSQNRDVYNCTTAAGAHRVGGVTDVSAFIRDTLPSRLITIKDGLYTNLATRGASVFLMGYYHVAESLNCQNGSPVGGGLDPDRAATGPLDAGERLYVDGVLDQLNAKLQSIATQYGWTFVPRQNYDGHEVCFAGTFLYRPHEHRWQNSITDSLINQGGSFLAGLVKPVAEGGNPDRTAEDKAGVNHPNLLGQLAMAQTLYNHAFIDSFSAAMCNRPVQTGVAVTAGPFRYNFATQEFLQQITVRNNNPTTAALGGQILVRLDGVGDQVELVVGGRRCPKSSLDPSVVPNQDSLYLSIGGGLLAGETYSTTLRFKSPGNALIRWTPTVLRFVQNEY